MAGQCRIDERGRRIKIAMDRSDLNLRHVLDMESSNLRPCSIETHHSDARGTYFYDSQPYNLRMGTHTNKQASNPAETSESELTTAQYSSYYSLAKAFSITQQQAQEEKI